MRRLVQRAHALEDALRARLARVGACARADELVLWQLGLAGASAAFLLDPLVEHILHPTALVRDVPLRVLYALLCALGAIIVRAQRNRDVAPTDMGARMHDNTTKQTAGRENTGRARLRAVPGGRRNASRAGLSFVALAGAITSGYLLALGDVGWFGASLAVSIFAEMFSGRWFTIERIDAPAPA